MIFDSALPANTLIFTKYHKPCAIFQSMLPLDKDKDIPSLTSALLPSPGLFNTATTSLSWKLHFITRALKAFLGKLRNREEWQNTIPKKVLHKYAVRGVEIDRKRNFYFTVKNIPELILSPIDLDFVRPRKSTHHYIGPLTERRTDSFYDYSFSLKIEAIKQKRKKTGAAIVYCSLGSRNMVQFKGCRAFLQRVIYAFRDLPYELIIAAGETIDVNSFKVVGNNIHIFQTVPQCELLKSTDLMITHGGMQSLTECIINEVPVLVYPLTSRWDQPGNSARVVYHKIGLRGNIKKERVPVLQKKINQLLTEPEFKLNIRALKHKIVKRHDTVDIGVIFDTLMSAGTTSNSLHKNLQEH
jgi:UDP:flavonoid glycosyltransferase YjiC (YdhE family)